MKKTLFDTLIKVSNKVWLLITTAITLTGITVFSVLPGIDFSLKNTSDQNLLIVELKNRSFLKITDLNPILYVDKIYTVEGDSVNKFKAGKSNLMPEELGGNQRHSIDYSFNEMFFLYNHRPQFMAARMALEVNYKFLFFDCSDSYFVECRPDFHGTYIWLETQEESYLGIMKSDTTKIRFDDIPYVKRLIDNNMVNPGPVLPIPQENKILE